jgi:uncharacterized protein
VLAALSADDEGRAASAPYLEAARRAASFIRDRMWNADTRALLRRYRDGRAEISGYAEDYAYLIFGLLELFQAESEPMWLEWAIALQRRQDELFWDDQSGGWFSTDGRDPTVLLRMKEDYDGAEPAPSSIGALNLLVLSHLVDEPTWTDRVERTLKLFGTRLEQAGRAVPMMAAALSTFVAGVQQIVIAVADERDGPSDRERPDPPAPIRRAIALRYLPFAVTVTVPPARRQALAGSLPFVAAMHAVNDCTAVYVCRNFSCRQPVTTADALEHELGTPA